MIGHLVSIELIPLLPFGEMIDVEALDVPPQLARERTEYLDLWCIALLTVVAAIFRLAQRLPEGDQ